MKFRANRLFFLAGGSLLLAAAVAACGGGSSSSPSIPPGATPAPTSSPTTSPNPTASPSSAPAATWTFAGSTATLTGTAGQTPALVSLAAYHNISATIQFGTDSAGSGTLNVSDALNNGTDVTPSTLPQDTATAGTTPLIYVSVYNGSTTTVSFGSNSPKVTVTDSAGFGSATTCELDVYAKNGGSSPTWNSIGASGAISGTTVTLNPVAISGTVDFQPGQQIIAIACK
ncbi:hypothetical protein EPN42_08610 [bacterium]|nr:MAG: hypothetical protein EPN42_08610 [bacterium]